MTVLRPALLASALLAATAPAALAQEEWTIDNTHTHILFAVNHFGMSMIHGEFLDFTGTLLVDQDAPENSSVEIVIAAASLDSGLEARDDHFRNADFFEVETYPEITFVSTAVEMTSETTAEITGDLTIKGITHSVVLDTTLNGVLDDHPMIEGTQPLAGFSASTTVLRSDYGVDAFTPHVGDEVEINIEMEVVGPSS